MGATVLEANLQTSRKIVIHSTDFSFEISQAFAIFSAVSLNIDEPKALNATKFREILKKMCGNY